MVSRGRGSLAEAGSTCLYPSSASENFDVRCSLRRQPEVIVEVDVVAVVVVLLSLVVDGPGSPSVLSLSIGDFCNSGANSSRFCDMASFE